VRIVCLSDTHMKHKRVAVPDGDVLVHTGDFTTRGYESEVVAFNAWLLTLPHKHKVVIAGNHDFLFQKEPHFAPLLLSAATYLRDSGCEIEGVKFWGSPWQPWFHNWAFNLERGPQLAAKWEVIPDDTDVLLTHSPPFGILDTVQRGEPVGCEELRKALARVRPQLHVFGHIHEAYGQTGIDGTWYVNASICDLGYAANNAPIVIDL
jgi:predicted phosphohydrolase